MKKIITLLAFFMFASAELTFASVAVTATPTLPSMTASTTSVTPSKEQTTKEWLKEKAKDLDQRQLIAAVLCFFLGTFGIHNFYLGRKKQAIWQLVLTLVGILTSLILIGLVILLAVWIWSIIDLVKILTGKMG